MSLRFANTMPPGLVLALAIGLAGLAWFLYRRETRSTVLGPLQWWLPTLRAIAIFLIALTLAQPMIESRVREGNPGMLAVAIDGSASMQLQDLLPSETRDANDGTELTTKPESNRYDRSIEQLFAPSTGIVPQLADRFDIAVARVERDTVTELWNSQTENLKKTADSNQIDEKEISPVTWTDSTALGTSLQSIAARYRRSTSAEPGSGAQNSIAGTAIVLFSDGQNTDGASPWEVAAELRSQGITLFCIGLGAQQGAADLAVKSLRIPQQLYRDDMLAGTITISERLADGTKYTADILYGDAVIWSEEFESQADQNREISVSFPVSDILEAAADEYSSDTQWSTLPVKLTCQVRCQEDLVAANNSSSAFANITNQQSRVLLIDGRSRWESRYLRNMFDRDPAWELTRAIALPTTSAHSGPAPLFSAADEANAKSGLPQTREELFEFDLVILGDVDARNFEKEHLVWLREFVEIGAGGIVLVDGARQYLRDESYGPLRALFPVSWTNRTSRLPSRIALTSTGEGVEALNFNNSDDVASAWAELPEIGFVSKVEVRSGAETLATAVSAGTPSPLIVTRQFGAGRVLYMATDETWRWRYKTADAIHTRLWNQLARWVMRSPYSVQREFISLDTGRPNYNLQQAIEIRCELRDASGRGSPDQAVTALILDENGRERRVVLTEDDQLPGTYRAVLGGDTASGGSARNSEALPSGDYRVRIEAAGFPQDALDVESTFSVTAPPSKEVQEVVCNESLLKSIAEASGGYYRHESEAEQIVELLNPMSGGKITLVTNPIWQSYWWFGLAILLLVLEWWLRKQAGLI